jgi:hypothetical protein
MTKARVAAVAGAALAGFLTGAVILAQPNATSGLGQDVLDIICSSLPTSVANAMGLGAAPDASTGNGSNGDHDVAPTGRYMPMFSTPPKSGIIYNGPPLDEC